MVRSNLDNSNDKEKLEQARKLLCFHGEWHNCSKWSKYSDIIYKKEHKLIGIYCFRNERKIIAK